MRQGVRAFAKEDLGEVLTLRQHCFGGTEHDSQDALARYFTELFFGHPWYDERLPSLVAEDRDHRIVGFLGVIPRPMMLDGARICVATTTHFMAARAAGPLVAVNLLRTLYEGPQDLSIADVSSAAVRQLWTYLGGTEIPTGTLTWNRVLRPAGHAAAKFVPRGTLSPFARLAARPLDAMLARRIAPLATPAPPASGARRPLADRDLLAALQDADERRGLHGVYDEASLAWLLGMMARKRWLGTLRRTRVVDDDGRPLGWYVLYTRQHRTALVAELGTRPGATGIVIDHLFHECAGLGATAVSGGFDTRIVDDVAARGGLILGTPNGIVVHSRDRDVLAGVVRASTPFSRLEGEWWMAF